MMQQLTIAGNVGKDAELRRTGNGDAVLGFSVAVDNGKDKNGNKRDSTWFDCSIWGKRAESLERYITKGTKVVLTGRPTVREHNGKAYLGISVNDLTFMGGNSQVEQRQDNYQAPQQTAQQDVDDFVPF
jgi:single-strand DNA-binding protein